MLSRDLINTLSYQRAISPVTQTNDSTAIVSQVIDMSTLHGLAFVIMTGTLSDANATFATLLEESDASDMSGSNEVADTDMLPLGTGQEAAASFDFGDDDSVLTIGYVGTKRYVRLTITPSGNDSGSAPIAVLAVGMPRHRGEVTGS